MKTSEQINELAIALAKVQGQLKPAKMDAVNPFLKNKYADLPSVIAACQPLMSNNGLSYVQMPTTPENGEFGISITTRLMHASGQWIEDTFFMPMPAEERGKSIMQVVGSAITYARRYAIASMIGIVADEDADGNLPAKQKQEPPKAIQQKQQAASRAYKDGTVVTNEANFAAFDAHVSVHGYAPDSHDALKAWAKQQKTQWSSFRQE